MKIITLASALALTAFAAPVFAQDLADLACAEFASMDNAGQMAVLADLKGMEAEMASSQELTPEALQEKIIQNCTANPDLMIEDAWRAIFE